MQGAAVNIHVGIEHKDYSPWVLLQEALQLCRCVKEHGAESITVALPEQYHPQLHRNQFNDLLQDLFVANGVNRLYFYDKNYQGKIEVASTEVVPCEKKRPVHIVLCCSANKPFAEKIAECLKARGENVKVCFIQGKGGEAMIPLDVELSNATVTLVQSTRPNPDDIKTSHAYQTNGASSYFFETMMVARQARLRGAKQVNLINPYQFSARSDKAEDNPNGKTGAYVQQNGVLLEAAGVDHVITAECHDNHTLSGAYTRKNMTSSAVKALELISAKVAKQWLQSSHAGKLRLVAPDAGAAKRTKALTQSLQTILGDNLCASRILGDKERGSHQDDSAHINELTSGGISINVKDKYLITDDETATGSTLCQAIQNLKKQGAQDISVIIAHNNMPLDWLSRQLCLARFLFMGVNDLHFSDTQEMGSLAKSYEDLIQTYAHHVSLSPQAVESKVQDWFEKNIPNAPLDKFKNIFKQLSQRVTVHSLADAFADKLVHQAKPSVLMSNTLFSNSKKISQESQSIVQQQTELKKFA